MADFLICLPDRAPSFFPKAQSPPFTAVPLHPWGSEVAYRIYTESSLASALCTKEVPGKLVQKLSAEQLILRVCVDVT